ncbi:metal-dependent hydrolase [Flavobacterium faecale]|uniref:Metal-dependent hydrolase n=1 Tax=Flavobacterium faecale TaxID=1355330 RepID=A0A2S1LG29_9FLAO|nr:putative metal-dependent hydrolase [Flavobacterium faecale]AWG22611.1 metal-dependent hydrolase [Flavobacterium faecale]
MDIEKQKFPIGSFVKPEIINAEQLSIWIESIASFPDRLKAEVQDLSNEQLDTPYRENGWTIRQVVHHCADSHLNSFARFKLALTEDKPFIKPYFEDRWAEMVDSKNFPIASSIKILEGIHLRWTAILKNLSATDLTRTFVHPEHGKSFSLDENIGVYAWHCDHHLAHITTLKIREGW